MWADILLAYGSFLGKLGKHVAEWTNADYDPDQTLRATASVLLLASPDPSTVSFTTTTAFRNTLINIAYIESSGYIPSSLLVPLRRD